MPSAYDQLVQTGFIGSLKRDVLLEASRDLEYLDAIRHAFAEAGDAANREATACTVQLIKDLTDKGLCSLATWSKDPGKRYERLHRTDAELVALVSESALTHGFKYFLVSTESGDAWVGRYFELVRDL